MPKVVEKFSDLRRVSPHPEDTLRAGFLK